MQYDKRRADKLHCSPLLIGILLYKLEPTASELQIYLKLQTYEINRSNLCITFACSLYGISTQAQRYVGGDISLLPDYEDAGAKYKDHDGKPIADLMPWLKEEG